MTGLNKAHNTRNLTLQSVYTRHMPRDLRQAHPAADAALQSADHRHPQKSRGDQSGAATPGVSQGYWLAVILYKYLLMPYGSTISGVALSL